METPPRNKTYGIVGLPRPADAVSRNDEQHKIPYVENLPVRREISALASSTDPDLRRQWTLFVLALEKFKLKPVNEKLSYFQVAGIVSDTPPLPCRLRTLTSSARLSRDALG